MRWSVRVNGAPWARSWALTAAQGRIWAEEQDGPAAVGAELPLVWIEVSASIAALVSGACLERAAIAAPVSTLGLGVIPVEV